MKILHVKALEHYRLHVVFEDGLAGELDLAHFAGRGVFKVWNEPGFFEKVTISSQGALCWPGELDLCPDAWYLQMTGKTAKELFPSLNDKFSHA
ncbi:MAG: DUF2442 domain-containing protein [Pirellulales bacterium]|nr:DUF2442 domain-containing protein [Pirellulales bacterium]